MCVYILEVPTQRFMNDDATHNYDKECFFKRHVFEEPKNVFETNTKVAFKTLQMKYENVD